VIDLLIVNYNTKDKLQRLLDTLEASIDDSSIDWSVFIADNGSTDGSVEWLRNTNVIARPRVSEVHFNENIGYAAAANILAARGRNPILAVLNSDIWFTGQDLAGVLKSFEELPDAGVIGPKQRDEDGSIRHAGIFGTNTNPAHRGWRELDPEDKLYRDRAKAVTVSGSAYFVRRSVWNELTECDKQNGILSANSDADGAFLLTPHYYEETWCSYHANHHGYNVYYDGTVSIGHTWHASAPVGEGRDSMWNVSKEMFRQACDKHNILRD
jgi:glycosyltransferase involved in cell wall biosynthesis